MSSTRNRDFGHRVKKRRIELGLKRKVVARLAGIPLERVEAIEAEQLDQSDLVEDQLDRLADILKCQLEWLVKGTESRGPAISAGVIAQRTIIGPIQGAFDFEDSFLTMNCPRCLHPARGSRCNNCGNFLE